MKSPHVSPQIKRKIDNKKKVNISNISISI
jgi:hypothetical protein